MSTFEQQHPDICKLLPDCKRYVNRTITGRIIEWYERDENGEWHDYTLREQEREKLEREIEQAKRILAKEEQQCETSTTA